MITNLGLVAVLIITIIHIYYLVTLFLHVLSLRAVLYTAILYSTPEEARVEKYKVNLKSAKLYPVSYFTLKFG